MIHAAVNYTQKRAGPNDRHVENDTQRNATLNGNVRYQANFKTLDNAAHGPGQGYISDDRGGHKTRQLGKRMERLIDHEQHAECSQSMHRG